MKCAFRPVVPVVLWTAAFAGPLDAADWYNLTDSVAGANDWNGAFSWYPSAAPDAAGAVADFSKHNYTAKNEVFLNGTRSVGTLKFGDTSDPIVQTVLSPGTPAGSLRLDNAGAGALIDTITSIGSPPVGAEFGLPRPANEIGMPVLLNDNLTLRINTGPTSTTATRWVGVNFTLPVTETGGPRQITVDGNGRGIVAFTGGASHSGGTLIKTGTAWVGLTGSFGSGDITVNATGQAVLQGTAARTIGNRFFIAGTGVVEPAGDRGALFVPKDKEITLSGGITLTAASRIEGGKGAITRLTGPLVGSSNLEFNALVQPDANEPRSGDFILEGDASGLTGKITVSRGSLTLGPASNPGGAMDVSKSARIGGETIIGGALRFGTNSPDAGSSTLLTIDPSTPGALQTAGNLTLSGTTLVRLDGLPATTAVKVLGYGGTLNGGPANLELVGGLASYRDGTSFDTTSSPGEVLLHLTRGAVTWNAGTGNWNTTELNWAGGDAFRFLDDVTFDDSSPSGGVVTIQGELQTGTILVNNSPGHDFVIEANSGDSTYPLPNFIASGSLVKDGAGKLTLGIDNNAARNLHRFRGGTTIRAGSVEVRQNGAASLDYGPLGAGPIRMTGGQLFATSNLGILLYNPMSIEGAVTLGDAAAPSSLSIASRVTLGSSVTLHTPSNIVLGKNNDTTTGVADNGSGYSLTKTGTGLLEFASATTNQIGGGTLVEGGTLRMRGTLGSPSLAIRSTALLSGDGTVNAPTVVEAGATVTADNGSTNAFFNTLGFGSSLDLEGSYRCDIGASSSDRLNVAGVLDISNATLDLNKLANPTAGALVIARYGSLSGTKFASVTGLPAGYFLNYAYNDGSGPNHIAVTLPNPFQKWALARGLVHGVNDGTGDDPNQDGTPNLVHFAFDTDPLGNGASSRNQRLEFDSSGGADRHLILTLPVRKGAVFSGSPPQATIHGITYRMPADSDFANPRDLSVVVQLPALANGLPPLGDYDGAAGEDWEYRSFRLVDPVTAHPAAFFFPEVSSAP